MSSSRHRNIFFTFFAAQKNKKARHSRSAPSNLFAAFLE
jgi:hypothetical protein